MNYDTWLVPLFAFLDTTLYSNVNILFYVIVDF